LKLFNGPEEFKQIYGGRMKPRAFLFGFSGVPLVVPPRVLNPVGASGL
jgi:hypothetical protein